MGARHNITHTLAPPVAVPTRSAHEPTPYGAGGYDSGASPGNLLRFGSSAAGSSTRNRVRSLPLF